MQLTLVEVAELEQHEAVIERGLNTFVDVGRALLAIRHRKLYRQEYGTFEEYCHRRWDITPRHGRRLIAAAQVVDNIGPMGPILPSTERQARGSVAVELHAHEVTHRCPHRRGGECPQLQTKQQHQQQQFLLLLFQFWQLLTWIYSYSTGGGYVSKGGVLSCGLRAGA